jgi:integrase
MARTAKLSKKRVGKHVYWYTESGGKPVYFGNFKEVSRKDAEQAFVNHRQTVLAKSNVSAESSQAEVSVADIVLEYLSWSQENHSAPNYSNKESSLKRWADHDTGVGLSGAGRKLGELAATKVTAAHLDDFISARRQDFATAGRGTGKDKETGEKPNKPIGPNALAGDMQHVKALFNWAADHERVPKDFRPFNRVPRIKIPPRPKHESELITPDEYEALLTVADYDLKEVRENGRFRRRTPAECRKGKDNPYRGFGDMLRLYHSLGARTGELATIRVRNVSFRKRQIVLEHHKRERTMTKTTARVLTLSDADLAILKPHCAGKSTNDFVFTQPQGKPWNQDRLDKRFDKVRKIAGIRETITIYSFRHLWISEAIEADVPMATIAEMAGTSIMQIEKTYGHIRRAHRDEARKRLDEYRGRQAS